MSQDYPSYPVFRGLQRPMEFLGLQGRYIAWAAGGAMGALIGFIVVYLIAGVLAGLLTIIGSIGTTMALIIIKQRKGLHSKKEYSGIFMFAHMKRL